jgi:hypothetical protein
MKNAWVVTVDMGYGHQRAAYPLKDIAFERIITANSDKIIIPAEKKVWLKAQRSYEWISQVRSIPIFGKPLFWLFDRIQSISPYYPLRDLSYPNLATFAAMRWIKKGLCKSVIQYINKAHLPLITTFPIPALAANYYGLKRIYCVVTDSDINRAWVAVNPKESNIKYFAPSDHTAKRLKQYGVPEKNIFITGFPLPKENIGSKNMEIVKRDISERLPNLDPEKVYIKKYTSFLHKNIGAVKQKSNHPLTITFCVGGAGAQKEIGVDVLESFKKKLLTKKIRINITTGTRLEITQYFVQRINELGLASQVNKNLFLIYALDKKSYFEKFNQCLHTTDILWTKPSELSFYAGLGIPIIIAPPLGSHEVYNKIWLEHRGCGFMQELPQYADEWITDWLKKGRFAEAAVDGFMKISCLGTYNIEKIVFGKS